MQTDLTKSSISGVLQFIVSLGFVFVSIPIFIKTLGTESYGLFSLVSIIGNLNTFVNLGLNASLVRSLAKRGKGEDSDCHIAVTFILLLIILVPFTFLAFSLRHFILSVLIGVPSRLMEMAIWIYISSLLCGTLLQIGQVFTAILDSQQKTFLTNFYLMLYNAFYWGLILLVIVLGHGLRAIALMAIIATVIWLLLVSIHALKIWGKISLRGLRSNWQRTAKSQIAYGSQIYLSGVVNFLYEPLTRILIAHYIGVKEVGIFDIGVRTKNLVYGFVSKLLYPLYPLLSKLSDREKIRSIVKDVSEKAILIVLPVSGLFILLVEPLVTLFFNSDIEVISQTILFMVVGYLLGSVPVIPIYHFLIAKGYARNTVLIQFLNALVNIIVFLSLFSFFKYSAALYGNVIALAVSFTVLIQYQQEYLGISFSRSKMGLIILFVITFVVFLLVIRRSLVGVASEWFVVLGPASLFLGIIILYRKMAIISSEDVTRYFGNKGPLSHLLRFLFIARYET